MFLSLTSTVKLRPNFSDSTFAFVLKDVPGMHWTSSRWRFTTRMKESLTCASSALSSSSCRRLFLWHIPGDAPPPSLFLLSYFSPCLLLSHSHTHTHTTEACLSFLRVPCLKTSSSLLLRLSKSMETHHRGEDVCEIPWASGAGQMHNNILLLVPHGGFLPTRYHYNTRAEACNKRNYNPTFWGNTLSCLH